MHRDPLIARRAAIHLRVGLFLDCRNDDRVPLGPRRIQQQEREAAIAGNEAEGH